MTQCRNFIYFADFLHLLSCVHSHHFPHPPHTPTVPTHPHTPPHTPTHPHTLIIRSYKIRIPYINVSLGIYTLFLKKNKQVIFIISCQIFSENLNNNLTKNSAEQVARNEWIQKSAKKSVFKIEKLLLCSYRYCTLKSILCLKMPEFVGGVGQ